ncbi:MAG: endonuclease MutS2, partial [Mogibacterium sp.]|nr:endonuclease MutS2 [Mogibacterium sp.]
MNTRALKLLEYNKIIDLLAEQAGSELTRERIRELVPMTNRRAVTDALTETTEAVSVILSKGNIPIGEIGDISGLLTMARKGRTLMMRELLSVRKSLGIARDVKNFLTHEVPEIPVIAAMVTLIETLPSLESEIDRCILSEDEMADNASPELRRIRRDMRTKNESIRSRLYKMTGSASYQKYLQDSIVTMRNGRYVLPVKKEYASLVPGLVHDQSQTGSTLFIEPQAIVTLNNELKELEGEEKAEIERILQVLTGRVAEHYHAIRNNQKLLLELDFISAKGKLSCLMDAFPPELNEDGILDILRGRHPLIPKKQVVPINVSLGEDWTTLLITGPNTGGKTVTLKTIGLFVLMAQSGLHIPCSEHSKIPVLRNVFADIGDEQSIEQSLSTFSAHMTNITEIFREAGEDSLVLLDELGAGTDPAEGAALGIAELEALRSRGALVVATTHYTELKKYALSTPGVENASMEFNVETLSPTYKLRVGLPGKSNAFEIAGKLGLEQDIIDRAAELLGENELSFEEAVTKVEEEKIEAERVTAEAEALRRDMQEQLEKARRELAEARMERDKLIRKAKQEAREILEEAQETVDEVKEELKNLRTDDRGHQINAMANSRRKLREAA